MSKRKKVFLLCIGTLLFFVFSFVFLLIIEFGFPPTIELAVLPAFPPVWGIGNPAGSCACSFDNFVGTWFMKQVNKDFNYSYPSWLDANAHFVEVKGDTMTGDLNGTNIGITGNITMADDKWIGLGAAKGRIIFDDTTSPDEIRLENADLNIIFPTDYKSSIAFVAKKFDSVDFPVITPFARHIAGFSRILMVEGAWFSKGVDSVRAQIYLGDVDNPFTKNAKWWLASDTLTQITSTNSINLEIDMDGDLVTIKDNFFVEEDANFGQKITTLDLNVLEDATIYGDFIVEGDANFGKTINALDINVQGTMRSDSYTDKNGINRFASWDGNEWDIDRRFTFQAGTTNLVDNGDFADDSVWTWGGVWEHDAVNLEADKPAEGSSALEQDISVVAGRRYCLTFTVLNRTAGRVTPSCGGVTFSNRNSDGTYTEYFTASSTAVLKFAANAAARLSLDDVSVVELPSMLFQNGVDFRFGAGGLTGALGADSIIYSDGTQMIWQVESPTGLLPATTNPAITIGYFDVGAAAFDLFVPKLSSSFGVFVFQRGLYIAGDAGADATLQWIHSDWKNTQEQAILQLDEDNGFLTLTSHGFDPLEFRFNHAGDVHLLKDDMKLFFGAASDASIYYNGTDWIFNAEVGEPDYLIQGFQTVRNDSNQQIDGNLNVDGNFTGNQIYGEMYFLDEVSPTTITITDANTYYQITGLSAGTLNGFSINDSNLTATQTGLYKLDYHVSFSGGSNNVFDLTIGINHAEQTNCENLRKIGTSADVGNIGGTCFVSISAADKIVLFIEDETTPTTNAKIYSVNINLIRIGS